MSRSEDACTEYQEPVAWQAQTCSDSAAYRLLQTGPRDYTVKRCDYREIRPSQQVMAMHHSHDDELPATCRARTQLQRKPEIEMLIIRAHHEFPRTLR